MYTSTPVGRRRLISLHGVQARFTTVSTHQNIDLLQLVVIAISVDFHIRNKYFGTSGKSIDAPFPTGTVAGCAVDYNFPINITCCSWATINEFTGINRHSQAYSKEIDIRWHSRHNKN